ncbi:MAG TPA: serine/threonine-protein kinase, partial [Streptomyces sp.]
GADIARHDDASPLQPLGPQDPRDQAGYRLLARIGEGGMGTVYLSHTRGGQPVALKVIRREFAQDEEFRQRFQQEVRAARRVQGYHVVPVVDHDTTGNQPWLATTYVPGLSLDDALARFGALPLPTVLQLVGCAAEALRAVHAAGVIHRDLKPSNILLAANGPWVIDFGIARAGDSTQLTRSGDLIGTPQFMSPEHANGQQLTPATDVFSLGLIAALAATGRHPYGEAGAITLATQIANTAMRPPDLSGYPDALRNLLEGCLAADPAARPTPAELARLCADFAGRDLRDFTGWLPQPVAAEINRRESAAQHPPRPEPLTAPPPTSATGFAAGPPPHQPPYQPSSAADPANSGRIQKVRAIGGGVIAVVLAVTLTYAFTRSSGKDDPSASGGPSGKPGTSVSQSRQPGTPDTPTAPDTDSPTTDDPAVDPDTTAPVGDPQVLIQDQKFIIRGPAWNSGTHVDLDKATAVPNARIGDTDDYEIEYQDWSGASMRFLTTFGKADGTTYEACRTGVGADALAGEITRDDLDKQTYIAKGAVLCTITSAGNLAMLKITDVTPSSDANDGMPTYSTLLTVWKMPDTPA